VFVTKFAKVYNIEKTCERFQDHFVKRNLHAFFYAWVMVGFSETSFGGGGL
jgi:hypothetical protein